LGILALWLAFRGVDWNVLRSALLSLNYSIASLGLLTVLITLLVSTARWRLLFFPDHRELRFGNLFSGIVLAQMLNIIIPARLGDVARLYAVESGGRHTKVRILTTVVVEKAVDLTMLALTVVLLLLTVSLPTWLRESGRALLVSSVVAVAVVLLLSSREKAFLEWLERMAEKVPGIWGNRLVRVGRSALDGFSAIRSGQISLYVWGLSLVILVLAAFTNYLLFLALDLRLPPIAALFLLVVLQVGIAPPSLPGKIGVFHYLTVLGLSVYSVEKSVALSYAIVLYVVALMPKIVIGTVILGFKKPPRRLQGAKAHEVS